MLTGVNVLMSTLGELLYHAVDGSFAIDAKQRIIYWDAGCEELLGHSEQWVLGRPCCGVLQGCYLVTGKIFCRENCAVARLYNGGDGPKTFMIEVKDRDNKPIALSVNIILVPSACKNDWHVMHLLHRSAYPDVLSTLDRVNRRLSSKRSKSCHERRLCEPSSLCARLTVRESEVLNLLSEGIGGSTIAKRLNISNTTVRNHIQHIQKKLGVHSQTEAVAYAYRHRFM